MLRAWEGQDPLLARPFSLHDVEEERFAVLYQVRGRGTELLSRLRRGDEISVLGPLGIGFPKPRKKEIFLVAGGIGVAPFLFAAKELLAAGYKVRLFYGARSAADLLRLNAFKRLGISVSLATEDGSRGHRGLVTEPLAKALEHTSAEVFACGPMPMLKAVAKLAQKYEVPAYVSLEARMACGLGLCLGCVVQAREGFLHVCREGPVVPAEKMLL